MKNNLIVFLLSIFICSELVISQSNSKLSTEQKKDSLNRVTIIIMNDGTKLSYFIEGEGYPCIVVTEGILLSNTLSTELKKHFKFIFVNARMNVSDPGDVNKITLDLIVDDVEQVRKAINEEKVMVFGHSISGLIALEYARKYPQYASHVIMNGSPPFYNDRFDSISGNYWQKNASKERKEALFNSWLNISRDSLNRAGTSDAGKLSYILDGPWYFYDYNFKATFFLEKVYWNMKVWNQIFSKLMINYEIGKGKLVETPVFLSLGKWDYALPYIEWDDQKNKIPNLNCILFEKSGHYSFYEEEELFRKKLLEWFESTKDKK